MTDASELYFKNVRSSSYSVNSNRETGMDVYLHRDFISSELDLIPRIIINWRQDKAFLLLEKNSKLKSDSISLVFSNEKEVQFEGLRHQESAELSCLIFNSILSGDTIKIREGRKWLVFFKDKADRETFRITFLDFLRLVELR